ncbi:hypothetical protein [Alteribacillus sp. HJP-4]|uniref:hypothetical protein n=1 Tax=Alteribacillus sp. HJP-4 TaxID=2775394 RepID=UPI0035CCE1A7
MNAEQISAYIELSNVWIAISFWVICFGWYFLYKWIDHWIAPPWKQNMQKEEAREDASDPSSRSSEAEQVD